MTSVAATRVAAIDCGTNSLRLLIAELPGPGGGGLVEVVRHMEIVRLGQGVDRTGLITAEALDRARGVLTGYAGQIAACGASRVRMVATSATRDAGNATAFTAMVEQTLGVRPEVVTGVEEARLSFTGAIAGLPGDLPGPYLVVDIGGGSTEFVVGDRDATIAGEVSVDIGCVRMTERHVRGDPPTAAQLAAAQAEVSAAVDTALAAVPAAGARTLVGLAGTVTTVAGIALELDAYRAERIHHARVGYPAVAKVAADLVASTHAQRLALPVMHPGRADVIIAGALILRTVMERAGFEEIVASEHDILDGIAQSIAWSQS